MPGHNGSESGPKSVEAAEPGPIFKWETLCEAGPYRLRYKEPVHGKLFEVKLTCGRKVTVFRADEEEFYFCHGLTFGGKDAPGGPVSPFSGEDVRTILEYHYRPVDPESHAVGGDILIWWRASGGTSHSAILLNPVVELGRNYLDYRSVLRSKNGVLPEADMTLQQLIDAPDGYGESYTVFRRR